MTRTWKLKQLFKAQYFFEDAHLKTVNRLSITITTNQIDSFYELDFYVEHSTDSKFSHGLCAPRGFFVRRL